MRTSSIIVASLLVAALAPAVAVTAAAQIPPQLVYTQPLAPTAVQQVQQRLRDTQDYPGRIDGVWGNDSMAALERFQQAHGLQVTGQLNQATLATLGLPVDQLLLAGQPATAGSSAPPVTGDAFSRASVEVVQSRLRDLRLYRGRIDGVWGEGTERAVERFQQGHGLQVNGELNPATVTALGVDPNSLTYR